MSQRDLVVIGASAGGVTALQSLVSKLPADFRAALLVVLHVGAHRSRLPELLSAKGPLPAAHAIDGDPLAPGRILVAPPDRHMLVAGHGVRLTRGPREHHTRPAIDPLFRSAALCCGPRTIGVVLTGRLDDGTAGLQAIKECGGLAVVQDPREAAVAEMPASALAYVEVDHCVPLAEIAGLLVALTAPGTPAPAVPAVPAELVHEHRLALAQGNAVEHLQAIAAPSNFACPSCGGTLWQLTNSSPERYRCHTGHGYSLRTLQQAQSEATDTALWGAIRTLQEKQQLLTELGAATRREGRVEQAEHLEALAAQVRRQTADLRALAESLSAIVPDGDT